MRIPLILYLGAAGQGVPLLVAAVRRPVLSPPRRWLLAWCGLLIVSEAIALVLLLRGVNNHWVNYISTPIGWGMVLWAMSYWQAGPVGFLAFRLLVPLLAITWSAIVLALENPRTFSLLAEPFAGLLVLGGAIYTLVIKVFREPGHLLRQDWLWLLGGICLVAGTAIALPITANVLLADSPRLVVKAYEIKAWFKIVAFVAIAWGVTCPIPAWRSGGFSSRASSRWRSYSLVSSRRW